MEYGRIPYTGLQEKNFIIDLTIRQPFLPGTRAKDPKLYWGFPKWGRKEWVGTVYPPGTKDANFLEHYIRYFNAVELNATHYEMPTELQIGKWEEKASGKDFLFCPKVLNEITHFGKLNDKEILLYEFIQRVKGFGDNLGPLLLQVSDKFAPARQTELMDFLEKISVPAFVEVRQSTWYDQPTMKLFCEYLARLGMGLVITDTPGKQDAINRQLTIPAAYIRFAGSGDHNLDYFRIEQWKVQIETWLEQGLERCYFFLQLYEQKKAFEFSMHVKAMLEPLFNKGNQHRSE